MCLKYRQNPGKECLFTAVVIAAVSQQTLVVPFLYDPILPHRSHFAVGFWWATGQLYPGTG